ncbi:glycosyltransferase involved in cell wall biosynthesis [Sphingomonas sp. PvP055]|uniref:glycosyltransferase family 4 protein n=1 Tax=Sphingomonas sp. PvP055 TaxID=3156391 RepID=UPI00339A7855
MKEAVVINGKFLSAPMTGVHRVATGLVEQIHCHQAEIEEMFGTRATIVAPRTVVQSDRFPGMTIDSRSVLSGQAWEQLELPVRTRGKLLLNFCNLAPVASAAAITMIHDTQVFTSPDSYARAFVHFYRTVQPLLGARAVRILTVSRYSAEQLVRWKVAPAERIRVVHNGVDHAFQTTRDPAILRDLGLGERRFVLALSNVQAHKNLAVLLEAFASDRLADLTLVLFGAAGRAEALAAGLVVPPNVRFAGRVSDGALRALTEAALCYAMPSRTEGFGLPPLEAMLSGCPAVVSLRGALPEVCGDAALYADPDRPKVWIAAIRALADDPAKRAKYAAMGRARAAGFTWARAGESLMDVLREVARERR